MPLTVSTELELRYSVSAARLSLSYIECMREQLPRIHVV